MALITMVPLFAAQPSDLLPCGAEQDVSTFYLRYVFRFGEIKLKIGVKVFCSHPKHLSISALRLKGPYSEVLPLLPLRCI